MAVPFGGHPTPDVFCRYAIQQGCREIGKIMMRDKDGEIVIRVLMGKHGLSVALPVLEKDEKFYVPSVVRGLCAKLGIKDFHSR